MILWLDAHVSPKLGPWTRREFEVDVVPVRDLGLREAEDREIFANARLKKILVAGLPEAMVMIRRGEPVVEISAAQERRSGRAHLTGRRSRRRPTARRA